jgi:hypothetical protein
MSIVAAQIFFFKVTNGMSVGMVLQVTPKEKKVYLPSLMMKVPDHLYV